MAEVTEISEAANAALREANVDNRFKTARCLRCEAALQTVEQEELKCRRCRMARYCSTECKKEHWSTHRETCEPYRKRAAVFTCLERNNGEVIVIRRTHKAALAQLKANEGVPDVSDMEFLTKNYPLPPGFKRWLLKDGWF